MAKKKTTQKNTKARQRAQAKYNSTTKQKKRRAARNAARRKMIKAGKARKGDGKDVAHKNNNPRDNKSSNLTMQSKAKNRSFKRNKKAQRKR
ncbi:MAG: hypothetical protein Tp178MES00d2C33159091_46 [Prokaryotic dsDNA virus sp.]|uniref:hypothetical protein n=1 Tax=Thalassospira sp. TaxID=1912094 RepID=UPI000C549A61|nr:hypothetical protein [Thalassospira sp.]QDP60995.1 MAG: hypothetical protein Tp178MES00d2C33159091_46 [Prokaryotic dsDNA virus sp.]MAZ33874.1 HNH endonuclease [Thalassospira sp.]MAZ33930.1 HNH endonuclease [Thalassospira sp.]MAZ34633.1 HNH endonuclease [Thalassospira sp.]QDP64500.1 MAG: hypothetical protein Tp178SUR1139111_20 [Prokaryotic dsDNA virus sp.]|tara:strand:- start:1553 stop:1828 length:276 start_codon:yes stop_codon:yes gene_type:complete